MKSNYVGNEFVRTTTRASVPNIDRGVNDKKERELTTVTLSAVVAVIVALYVVMFASVYLWSRYAPIFPPNIVDGPTMAEATPWS